MVHQNAIKGRSSEREIGVPGISAADVGGGRHCSKAVQGAFGVIPCSFVLSSSLVTPVTCIRER